jgi:hypothetical protein
MASSCPYTPPVAARVMDVWLRRMAIQRMRSSASSGLESCNCSTISRVCRSMSGWKKRLNSATPAAPAASRRLTKWGSEEKKGRQLHHHRNIHHPAQLGQQGHVAGLHRVAALQRVGGHVVDVEFEGIGADALQLLAQVDPAGGRHPVEAGDHRDIQARLGQAQVFQIALEGALEIAVVGQEAGGLGVVEFAVQQEALRHGVLGDELLFVQGVQHHRSGAGVLQQQQGIKGLGEGRGRGHQRDS